MSVCVCLCLCVGERVRVSQRKSLRVCVDPIPEDFVHQGVISSAARARLNNELEGVCCVSLARVQEMFSKTY